MLVDFHNNQTRLDKKLNLVTYKLGQLTSKVTTEVLEKGTRQPKTIMQINQKQKSKIHYDKKAESEFFVDNSASSRFYWGTYPLHVSERIDRELTGFMRNKSHFASYSFETKDS